MLRHARKQGYGNWPGSKGVKVRSSEALDLKGKIQLHKIFALMSQVVRLQASEFASILVACKQGSNYSSIR